MKLREKIFPVIAEGGKSFDLRKEKRIPVLINKEDRGAELKDFFIRHSFDDSDEILGFSLLQFFALKDGELVDSEGNTISLFLPEQNISLKFKPITKKLVPLDPIEVPVTYVEAFSYSLVGIQKPEVVFSELSNPERKTIVETRQAKELVETQAREKASADKARADAEAKARAEVKAKGYADTIAKVQADAEAKAKAEEKAEADKAKTIADAKVKADLDKEKAAAEIKFKNSLNPKFVYEKKDYNELKQLFEDDKGNVHIQEPYHFFYVAPTEEEPNPRDPTVLIKRGAEWWQEDEDGEIIKENTKTAEYEFSDGEQHKIVLLDVENGSITVNNAG